MVPIISKSPKFWTGLSDSSSSKFEEAASIRMSGRSFGNSMEVVFKLSAQRAASACNPQICLRQIQFDFEFAHPPRPRRISFWNRGPFTVIMPILLWRIAASCTFHCATAVVVSTMLTCCHHMRRWISQADSRPNLPADTYHAERRRSPPRFPETAP